MPAIEAEKWGTEDAAQPGKKTNLLLEATRSPRLIFTARRSEDCSERDALWFADHDLSEITGGYGTLIRIRVRAFFSRNFAPIKLVPTTQDDADVETQTVLN